MTRPNGQVCFAHVLAWFICDFCGEDTQRLSKAAVYADGRISPIAERPPGEIECNNCFQKRRKEEEERAKVRRERAAWARQRPLKH